MREYIVLLRSQDPVLVMANEAPEPCVDLPFIFVGPALFHASEFIGAFPAEAFQGSMPVPKPAKQGVN